MVFDDFVLFSGDDGLSCEFMCEGGYGVIFVMVNIVFKVIV